MDEWHIGDPVDWGDGWMDAQNWGHGGNDEEEDCGSESYGSHGSYGGYSSYVDTNQRNRNRLNHKKNSYERKLKEAREERNDEYRIRYYCEALEYADEYFEESEKLGITIDGMPDRNHIFSSEDIAWISKRHYDEFYKLHILSTDQTGNLERLLKQSGNGHIIKKNDETRRIRNEENSRRMGIDRAKRLNEEYFKRIEKANELALKNKPRHALKEYQKAIRAYELFFKSRYVNEGMKRKMPDKSLTPEAVDHILTIYKSNHPLLKSGHVNEKINREILDMLEGDWDGSLREADREVREILHQKQLERQKRKEKVEDIAVDVIVGARIVGNSILNRFRK